MSIENNTDMTSEFHRLADQPAPPYLVDLGQIVTTGRREKRRRRVARAALTTTTAAVALCGVAAVAHFSVQPGQVPSAAPASLASTPSASSIARAHGAESASPTDSSTGAAATFPMCDQLMS